MLRYMTTHTYAHSVPRSRCVQLRLGEPNERAVADMWDQFFNRLLENLLQAFKRRVEQYEEELRSYMVNRLSPDWNYCRFFELKVCERGLFVRCTG